MEPRIYGFTEQRKEEIGAQKAFPRGGEGDIESKWTSSLMSL